MNGFLKLTTAMGLATERVIPVDDVACLDTPVPASHQTGSCRITLRDGTLIDLTAGTAYAAVLSNIASLGYTVA